MFWKTLTDRLRRARGPKSRPGPEVTDPLRALERDFGAARERYRELHYEGSLPEPDPRAVAGKRARLWPWPVGITAAALVLLLVLLLPARHIDAPSSDARFAATGTPLVWQPKGKVSRPAPRLARPTLKDGRMPGLQLPRRPQRIQRTQRSTQG